MLLSRIKEKYNIVIASPNFTSDNLDILYSMIISGEGTYENLMSSNRDEEWEFQQEENDETDRERWAKQQDKFNADMGNAAHFFERPKRIEDVWLIHFTNANPIHILKNGFKGRDHFGIGLTTMFKQDANKGNLAFAYRVEKINEMFKYGKYAVLLKVPEALVAYHIGDEEEQAIFDVKHVEEMYEIGQDRNTDEMVIEDEHGNELGRCEADKACPSLLVDMITKHKKKS